MSRGVTDQSLQALLKPSDYAKHSFRLWTYATFSHPDRLLVQMPASDNQPVQQAKQELDTLADRDADSTDSDVRYMAYAARLRTVLRAGTRYIAYVRLLSSLSSEFCLLYSR